MQILNWVNISHQKLLGEWQMCFCKSRQGKATPPTYAMNGLNGTFELLYYGDLLEDGGRANQHWLSHISHLDGSGDMKKSRIRFRVSCSNVNGVVVSTNRGPKCEHKHLQFLLIIRWPWNVKQNRQKQGKWDSEWPIWGKVLQHWLAVGG